MAKLNLILVFVVFTSTIQAQIPKEAFDLSNSLHTTMSEGKVEQAVDDMIKLNELYRPFFVEKMHNSIAQYLVTTSNYYDAERGAQAEALIRKLYDKNIPEINEELWAMMSWVDMDQAKSPRKTRKVAAEILNQLPPNDSDWGSVTRYVLMGLNIMRDRGLANDSAFLKLYGKVLDYLQVSYKSDPADQGIRYFLSYCYFKESEKNPGDKTIYLKKASDVSPDHTSNAYFYDMIFLDPKENRHGFKQEYLSYLISEKKYDDALNISLNLAVASPVDKNLQQLKTLYGKTVMGKNTSFKDYWSKAISDKAEPLPTTWFVNDLKDTVQIWSPTKNWTFIDVWGTWCSPCVKELPDFQIYYDSIQARSDIPLEIVTWGFDQQEKFDKFMEENEYEFPIINVTMPFQKVFRINSWPTKILITPEGKYFKIPFGQDYKMWIKNCLTY